MCVVVVVVGGGGSGGVHGVYDNVQYTFSCPTACGLNMHCWCGVLSSRRVCSVFDVHYQPSAIP